MKQRTKLYSRKTKLDAYKEILIGAIKYKSGEQIRVGIDEFRNRTIANIRRWYVDKNGNLKPTKKGITLSVQKLPELLRLIEKAVKRAQREGLVLEVEEFGR